MSPSFAELGVPKDLVAVLRRNGINDPFEIQSATIPDAMNGRDVLGRAPTGSGKTLAFGLPLVAKLREAKPHRPTALILSPTRELAEQIRRELAPLAEIRGLRTLAIYGGVGFGPQLKALREGVDLVVACPGRLLDLIEQRQIILDDVRYAVVDEADRMADMGFLPDVRRILDLTSARQQTVLFSATLGKEVKVLTDRYQDNAVLHEVGEAEPDLTLVRHRFIRTDRHGKVPLAAHFIDENGPTIVFCRTRYGVDRVARQLKGQGIKTSLIHGKRTQNQRDNALAAFTKGKVDALVATDVAARGIHVDAVACVLHFDVPEDDKAYVHRSGRTARAGASGVVVSFINTDQVKDMRQIQRQVGLNVELEDAPDLSDAPERPKIVDERPSGRTGHAEHKNGQRRRGQQKGRQGQKATAGGRKGGHSRNKRSGQGSGQGGGQGQSKAGSRSGKPGAKRGGRPGAKSSGGPNRGPKNRSGGQRSGGKGRSSGRGRSSGGSGARR